MLRTMTATTIYFRKLVSNCGKPTLSLEETQNSALGCIGWLLIQPLPNTERKRKEHKERWDNLQEEIDEEIDNETRDKGPTGPLGERRVSLEDCWDQACPCPPNK